MWCSQNDHRKVFVERTHPAEDIRGKRRNRNIEITWTGSRISLVQNKKKHNVRKYIRIIYITHHVLQYYRSHMSHISIRTWALGIWCLHSNVGGYLPGRGTSALLIARRVMPPESPRPQIKCVVVEHVLVVFDGGIMNLTQKQTSKSHWPGSVEDLSAAPVAIILRIEDRCGLDSTLPKYNWCLGSFVLWYLSSRREI